MSPVIIFFSKQKTVYGMRMCDWSSDVCSSDLGARSGGRFGRGKRARRIEPPPISRIGARIEGQEEPALSTTSAQYDVIIIGSGAAGLTAAIEIGRAHV